MLLSLDGKKREIRNQPKYEFVAEEIKLIFIKFIDTMKLNKKENSHVEVR